MSMGINGFFLLLLVVVVGKLHDPVHGFSVQTRGAKISYTRKPRVQPTACTFTNSIPENAVSEDLSVPSIVSTQRRQTPPCGKQSRTRRYRRVLLSSALLCLTLVSGFAKTALASTTTPMVAPAAVTPLHPGTVTVESYRVLSPMMQLALTSRLVVAAVAGAVVGWERASTKHSAGVRTMALVSLGASAFTICSIYGFMGRCDTSRMASSVASGVGFIGAGVITTTSTKPQKNIVHGLTTAAAIWLSAAVGVASGAGLYIIAGAAAAITVAILRLGRITKSNPTPPNRRRELHDDSLSFSTEPEYVLHSEDLVSEPEPLQPPPRARDADNKPPIRSVAAVPEPDSSFLEFRTADGTVTSNRTGTDIWRVGADVHYDFVGGVVEQSRVKREDVPTDDVRHP